MALVDKDREVLQKLADKSPQGFAWAKSFMDARKENPRLELDSFLKERNIPHTDYIRELQKSGRAAGDVLQAMQHEPGMTSQLASKINVADRMAPTMPKATTTGEEALAKLAKEDPKSYATMKAFIDEQKAKPGTELGSFLKKMGVDEAKFIDQVTKITSSHSGDLLNTMRKAADFVEGLTKFVSHTKLGKAITAGGVLLGAITGANASTLPQAGKDFAKAAVGAMDPTALVGPSIAEHALSKAIDPTQKTEFDKMGVDTGKIGVQKNAVAIATFNARIDREEKFLMSAEHPAQLGSLKFKDKNGKDVDVEKALKDPAQRSSVMAEIDRREAAATTPEMKQLYGDMKEAAQTFAAMEDRRKPMPPDIIAAQKAQPQPAAPAMAG